jgi:HD-GYP domain-containing protein (c-di-GMP phosphodiesterase class II)
LTRYVGTDLPLNKRVPRALAVARGQPQIAREGFEATCDIAMNIAGRLGMPAEVQAAIGAMFEHWDGHGMPDGLRGTAIPLVSRVVFPTFTLAPVARHFGREAAVALTERQRGSAFDPAIADAFLDLAAQEGFWTEFEGPDVWQRVLDLEPQPGGAPFTDEQLDDLALAFADFTDLKAPHILAHSRRTAALAEALARVLGCLERTVADIRRAALVHDLGLVAIPSRVLEKPEEELTAVEREQLRLHPYYSERILRQAPALAPLAEIAGLHHERLDGRGYFRGLTETQIPLSSRIVAVAARYDELTHAAPGRPPLAQADALADLRSGGYASEVVAAIESALGIKPPPPASRPAGLTEREIGVLQLAARGHTRREIGRRLQLSENTVRHHLEHIYTKAGVSNRVAAAMFAMEQGLLD